MDKNKKEANTKPVVVKGGRSLTGQPLNPIDINPQLNKKQVNEQSRGGVVLTFGRMNPPTVGHEKLVNKLISVASKEKATPMVFLSHSQDKKKNPLEHKDKVRFAKMAFGNVVQNSPARTLIDILKSLEGKFKTATVVVGDDRVKEFTELLNKYNGKDYNFDSINVVSAGQRDPDAEGVEGMSASKMRQAIVDKDAQRFKSGLPSRLKASAREVYDLLRHGMKLQEELEQEELLGEALSIDQRRKRGLVMRKYQAKISRARELASKRLAPTERLKKRARNKAIELVRRRVAGKRGMDYAKLSPSEKMQVDKAVEKRKKAIGKIAARIYPSVKTAEFERLKSYMHGHKLDHLHTNANVNEELNALFEQHHTAVKPQTLGDIINEMVSVATARVITEKEVQALEKKAEKYDVEYDLIEQVFMRGLLDTVGDHQAAFNRVNAFVNGGRTAKNEDLDLFEAAGLDEAFSKASEARKKIEKVDRKPPHTEHGKQAEIQTKIIDEDINDVFEAGLWDNIHAKRKRIKSGSGERMRKPGSEGAPTKQNFKDASESVQEGYDVNSKHYKALTDLDLNTKNRDMTTQKDGYGPLNPNDEKGSKSFWDAKAKMWKTTTEAAMEARCGNCAAFNQSPAVMKKMAEGLGPAGEKIQDLANLGFCELFEFKCAGDRTCNKWLVNGPIKEEVRSADKGPVVVPAHKDAENNTIPAKTVMRKKNRVIVNPGDNSTDGK
jgi:nicotinic acid mononucleotide adenylyltransferase